jgi:hypothetical protein
VLFRSVWNISWDKVTGKGEVSGQSGYIWVIKKTKEHLVIKRPGGSYWSGMSGTRYSKASFEVWKINKVIGDTEIQGERILDFPARGIDVSD